MNRPAYTISPGKLEKSFKKLFVAISSLPDLFSHKSS